MAAQPEAELENVLALVLPRHLHFLPKAISDGHQPLGLPRHATRETSCASTSQDIFRHPHDWCLPQTYVYPLFSVTVENQE